LSKEISILIPCFNESGNVTAIFERIANALQGRKFEVIFVDDGSYDRTYAEISLIVQRNPDKAHVISHKSNLGIPAAWMSGLTLARSEYICLIDGDLQNPPESIPYLMQVLDEQQADVVQGTRSSIGRLKDGRLFYSRGLNLILNKVFNQSAIDSKSGFIVSHKHVLEAVFRDIPKFKHFQTFLGVALRARGYRVVETETLFVSREVGESFLTNLKITEVVFTTIRDIVVGLKLYGRNSSQLELLYRSNQFKSELPFIRRKLFNIYFKTFFLHKWIIGKKAKDYYYWLKQTEFASKSELENIQLRRLQRLLQNAYLNVPYYRRAFDSIGFKPNQLKKIDDIVDVPLLTKSAVRENVYFSLFSENHNKNEMHKISTSGSTGEPFVCYADKFQLEMRFATTLRALEMSGWRFGDRQLRLWHQTLGMSRIQAFKERVDALFMRRHFVPAFEMSTNSIAQLIRLIEKKKPVLIDGYAESLNFIASSSDIAIKHKPKALMSSAQQLTDATRSTIERVFGAKVLDKYGSREFSGIAYQCLESENHHVQDESYFVEILVDGRPALPGETGEVVITDLNNLSMPLIRYRIGDMAVAVEQNPCKCGRNHKLIGQISGRTQALILCSNGVWLPGTFFAHFFKDFDFAVKHYQVVQEKKESFRVLIVPNPQFSSQIEMRIIEKLRKYTGDFQVIEIQIVNQIPLLKTGKRTPVISSITPDFQEILGSKIWKK
jgi:phenylacetate-CoA ligase